MCEVSFDRRIADSVLAMFCDGGMYRPIVDVCLADRTMFDVQLRRNARTPLGGKCWVSVYAGLAAVMTIRFNSGRARVETDRTHRPHSTDVPTEPEEPTGPEPSADLNPVDHLEPTEADALDRDNPESFDPRWLDWQPPEDLASDIDGLCEFIRYASDHVARGQRWLDAEGRVHPALSASDDPSFRTVNREVSVGFRSAREREDCLTRIVAPYESALAAQERRPRWWPTRMPRGTGCDFLAIDEEGRLLALEAKPGSPGAAPAIAKGPMQVGLYAELIRAWVTCTSGHAEIVNGMLDQRVRMGLTRPGVEIATNPDVVPVLAIGPGSVSDETMSRAGRLASILARAPSAGIARLEIWRVDGAGRRTHVEVIE